MNKILALILALLCLVSLTTFGQAPPILRQFGTTNTAPVLTNIIKSLINTANVFTNDGNFVHLAGTVTNVDAPFSFGDDGSFLIGTNVYTQYSPAAGSIHALGALNYSGLGQPSVLFWDMSENDDTLQKNFATIHGASEMSPQRTTWSLTTGTDAGSTNLLTLKATDNADWWNAKVDGTNRAFLAYSGLLTAQGFLDASGTPGSIVAYGLSGRLVPTNVVSSSNAYFTNLFVNNEFVDNITITNGITNLSLTANTVLQTDANKVITNEVAAVLVQAPGNHVFSGSNYFGKAFTSSTNLCNGVPDFSKPSSIFETNNTIVFAAPIGIDTTKVTEQWILVTATNSTAVVVPIVAPANVHLVSALTAFCTNQTLCWFQCYAGGFTNLLCTPVF